MKTIVDALKGLYVALGGSADDVADVTLNPDMIDAITGLVSGGALKELPAVTVADDGDVLAVVDGVWTNATPGQ